MNSRRRHNIIRIRAYYIIRLCAVGVAGFGPRGRVPQKASQRHETCSFGYVVITILRIFENYEKLSDCKNKKRNVFLLNNYIMPTPYYKTVQGYEISNYTRTDVFRFPLHAKYASLHY